MMQTIIVQPTNPFESASELLESHHALLEKFDESLGEGADVDEKAVIRKLIQEITAFLERGAATGQWLEDVKARTRCQVVLDYWTSSIERAGFSVQGARLQRFNHESLPDLSDFLSPYVGLEAIDNESYFFGRDQEVDALTKQIARSPMVVVSGPSGSGKSSLILGGVLPAVKKSSPDTIVLPPWSPGDDLVANFAQSLRTLDGADITNPEFMLKDSNYLLNSLRKVSHEQVLIFIDQFEEVFTLSDRTTRDALARNLSALLQKSDRFRVLLTIREEFRSNMATLAPFEAFSENYWYTMPPMGYQQLLAVVKRPAELVNLQYQPGIADSIVKRVLGQPAALPLLQFTLKRLWESRDRNRITKEVYEKVGDPLTALQTACDMFYEQLVKETRDEVKRILLSLIRIDELLEAYRQPVRKTTLLSAGRANTEEVLSLLDQNEFIRISDAAGGDGTVVEVRHESLIRNWPRLINWIDQKRMDRRARMALTEAADKWDRESRPHEGLLSEWQLHNARNYDDLSPLEASFVDASEKWVVRRANWKFKVAFLLIGIFCLLAGWGVVLSVFQLKLSAQEKQLADSQTALADSQTALADSQTALADSQSALADKQREVDRNKATLVAMSEDFFELQKTFDQANKVSSQIAMDKSIIELATGIWLLLYVYDIDEPVNLVFYPADTDQKGILKMLTRKINQDKKIECSIEAPSKQPPAKTKIIYSSEASTQYAQVAWNIGPLLGKYLFIYKDSREMHRYKWDENKIEIRFSPDALGKFIKGHSSEEL